MAQIVVFLALLFSIVIAIFAVQNTTSVGVSFLTVRVESLAVSVLVLISAALGALAMLLLGIAREVRLRWRQRSIGQQLKAAQARIAQLEAVQPAPEVAPAALPPQREAAPAPAAADTGGPAAPV